MKRARFWLCLLSAAGSAYLSLGCFIPATALAAPPGAVVAAPSKAGGENQADEEVGGKWAREEKETREEEAKEEECAPTFGPIITDTAVPIGKGRFAVQPTFGLSLVTDNFSPSWRRISAGGDFKSFGMSLKLTYGLFNNLEVYTVIPYLHNWASQVDEPGPRGERAADFGGLGDINLTLKYRLITEGPVVPTVSAMFATTFPSGHFQHLNPGRLGTDALGTATYAFTTGLNVSKCLKPFIFYGNFWYTLQTDSRTRTVDGVGNPIERRNHPRDFINVNLAAEYPIAGKWVALLEVTSAWGAGRLVGPGPNSERTALLSLLPGIEYMATEKFSLALGVNFDLAGKNTSANLTPLLSMAYAF